MSDQVTAFAPGRVNLIGEHTDYNDGLALAFAVDEGVTVVARHAGGRRVSAVARDLGAEDSFELDAIEPAVGWRAFVRGTVAELARSGISLPGMEIEISGDLQQGGGLGSSAALEVALALALGALAGAPAADRLELAGLCARVENYWVGTRSGLLDQIASLYGQRGRGVRIDFRSLDIQPVALELGEHRLVTLDSGERRVNLASGYNERREECALACELLGVGSLREASAPAARDLAAPLSWRVRHVIAENDRVEAAVKALARHDLPQLGRLLDASHASLRDDFEVSTPAVESAVERMKRAGAIGARLMGGGFGGHVLGLFPAEGQPPDGAREVRPGPGAALVG
ncbi:MAG TPA: galactokinase family protein [Solirubrobacteraceae bacterium]|nr:galactokinase family protein [Solirubrobacteraceae bacterium]